MSRLDNDKDLLDRFNALKPIKASSSITSSPTHDKPQDDLAARFLRFSAIEQQGGVNSRDCEAKFPLAANVDEDDKALEDLLADIGPQDQWLLGADEPKDIERLLDEAKASLSTSAQEDVINTTSEEETESAHHASKEAADLSQEVQNEAEDSLHAARLLVTSGLEKDASTESPTEDEEAALSLQRILDELSLENSLSNPDMLAKQEHHTSQPDGENTASPELDLDLPSAPGTVPLSSSTQLQLDELGLPSAPTSRPSKKTAKTNLPTYTNEEIDSWCIICNDDATICCIGCDDDLYCAKCWREGHTGPDVGYEEKRHKWTKYTKPK